MAMVNGLQRLVPLPVLPTLTGTEEGPPARAECRAVAAGPMTGTEVDAPDRVAHLGRAAHPGLEDPEVAVGWQTAGFWEAVGRGNDS